MQRTYLEIGTSDFDTLNEKFKDRDDWYGISIEAVPEYFNRLEKYDKNEYVNAICVVSSLAPDKASFHYIPSQKISEFDLPNWLRGCGSLNSYHPMLQKYDKYVVHTELPTISVDKIVKYYVQKHLDLLKVDTECYDYAIVKSFLKYTNIRPTHIIFETCHMSNMELNEIYTLLREFHYQYIKRVGDSVQFSKKSVLLIVDESWSTGSIAKDLRYLSKDKEWNITLLDWTINPPINLLPTIFSEFDAVACFTLGASRAWPILKNHGLICCGEVEFEQNIRNHIFLPEAKCFGSVSPQIFNILAKYSSKPIFYTPASARISRFEKSKPRDQIKTIGFCGSKQHKTVKNYELFQHIAELTELKTLVSEKHYTYDTIHKFYNSIDLLICTSYSEGGPLPVFEAIASGIPVISTPVGLTNLFNSIPKFVTAHQAKCLINGFNQPQSLSSFHQLQTDQYQELSTFHSFEYYLPVWYNFFECTKHQETKFL